MAKKHKGNHNSHERWLVSYADFITLLFAFFTVMYATSNKDQEKEKRFEKSIKTAFASLMPRSGGMADEIQIDEANTVIPPPIEVFHRDEVGPIELSQALEKVIKEKVDEGDLKKAEVEFTHDKIGARIRFGAQAFFKEGTANLNPEVLPVLDQVAATLKLTHQKLIIEGHTDNQPINTPIYPSNWELSGARAAKIVRYFIIKHQISADRLVSVSYADQKPIASNETAEGRARNRRIEIQLLTKPSAL